MGRFLRGQISYKRISRYFAYVTRRCDVQAELPETSYLDDSLNFLDNEKRLRNELLDFTSEESTVLLIKGEQSILFQKR